VTHCLFDESGDLGFDFSKEGTSKHLIITLMIAEDKRPVSALVKKVFKTLPPARKHKSGGELHARYEKEITVKRLLSALATKDIKIASMRLDKRKLLISGNPNELYTSVVISLINRLYSDGHISDNDSISLIASRRNTSKYLNERFSESVVNRATGKFNFKVSIVKPYDDKCLQAVDFVSWAFWQKYEKGDSTYFDIISDKVISEYVMYS
jgi:hypothetical protein